MASMMEDPMFSSRTDHELLSWYNTAVARMRLKGKPIEPVKSFPERQALIDACETLHNDLTLIDAAEKAQTAEGASKDPAPNNGAGSVRPEDKKSRAAKKVSASADAGHRRAAAKTEEKSKMASTATAPAPAGQKPRKRDAGTLAPSAPAPRGKKTAPAPAPEPTKTPRRTDFDDNAKITWLWEKNGPIPGTRDGSAKQERWNVVRAHNGKKVSAYRASGGNMITLANAVDKEAASVG